MEKLTLTRISVTDKKKDGTVLENQYGKFYRVGIQTVEYGDVWINGFSSKPVTWQEGDVVELEVSKEEWNGQEQLKFRHPKKEDVLKDENEKLKAELAKLKGESEDVIDAEDEPF